MKKGQLATKLIIVGIIALIVVSAIWFTMVKKTVVTVQSEKEFCSNNPTVSETPTGHLCDRGNNDFPPGYKPYVEPSN